MAKKHQANIITTSFHYLEKRIDAEGGRVGFTKEEFSMVVERISNAEPLNERDPDVIDRMKNGLYVPFSEHEELEKNLHFGRFDGAYYGQEYRNNVHGVISAQRLNLRQFNYLISHLRDGKILVAVTYNGLFGDYDGLLR